MPSTFESRTQTPFESFEQREASLLAPYAMHSADSRGRELPEQPHAYRGPYQRDRDRILHSAAFRRLSGKMQVFTGDMGDYHRTRLTHTTEVASIARTLCRVWKLNEDLVEALALFHDIGHPPFGHAGEEALNECLRDDGGFSHNRFALTLARELEPSGHRQAGLNLTFEVLEGQQSRAQKSSPTGVAWLEVQVVDAADSMTYNAHDTDDAIELGLVTLADLKEIPLVRDLLREITEHQGNLPDERRRRALVHALIDRQVVDLLNETGPRLAAASFGSARAVCEAEFQIRHSPQMMEQKSQLEQFLYHQVYRHPQLIRVRRRAQERLRGLFQRFRLQPDRLPAAFRSRAEEVGPARSAGDFLASVTDRHCDRLYERHFPPGAGG